MRAASPAPHSGTPSEFNSLLTAQPVKHLFAVADIVDSPGARSASPASRMLDSDWSYATRELLQVTGKDIIEER